MNFKSLLSNIYRPIEGWVLFIRGFSDGCRGLAMLDKQPKVYQKGYSHGEFFRLN